MVQELEVKKIPLSLIKFDETNPNDLSKEQMQSLKLTMEKFGYLAPVILNKDFTVVDGEHRVKIYQELGKQEIQAYVIDVDQIDLKILRQLMNKLRGEHDKQKDALEFKSIFEANKLDEFSKLLATPKENFEQILAKKFNIDFVNESEPIPEIPRETNVKLGDIYQLGDHKVMCGDCTIKENVDKLLDGQSVDLLLSDPPYNVSYSSLGKNKDLKITNDNLNECDFLSFIISVFQTCDPLLKDGCPIYLCHGDKGRYAIPFYELFQALDYTRSASLIWEKNVASMGYQDYRSQHEVISYGWKGKSPYFTDDRTQTTILKIKRDNPNQYVHPTQKPIDLLRTPIINSSIIDNLVYDPFLGSGSTLIACESTKRRCYGMELDPYYVDVIIRRWENYTGKKAVKISSI